MGSQRGLRCGRTSGWRLKCGGQIHLGPSPNRLRFQKRFSSIRRLQYESVCAGLLQRRFQLCVGCRGIGRSGLSGIPRRRRFRGVLGEVAGGLAADEVGTERNSGHCVPARSHCDCVERTGEGSIADAFADGANCAGICHEGSYIAPILTDTVAVLVLVKVAKCTRM